MSQAWQMNSTYPFSRTLVKSQSKTSFEGNSYAPCALAVRSIFGRTMMERISMNSLFSEREFPENFKLKGWST